MPFILFLFDNIIRMPFILFLFYIIRTQMKLSAWKDGGGGLLGEECFWPRYEMPGLFCLGMIFLED